MKVLNMFGGPGTGKSTTALGVAHVLKGKYQINSEYVSEYAKELAWENNTVLISDQLHVTANQNRGLERLRGNVDFAVCDSPLILGIHYSTNYFLKSYEAMVVELFHSYDNLNFFVERVKPYNPKGRFQSELEAIHIDHEILQLLNRKNIPYISVRGDENAVDKIIKHLDHPSILKHNVVRNENCYYCTRCNEAHGDGDGFVGELCPGHPIENAS